jgi:hypothetical protein
LETSLSGLALRVSWMLGEDMEEFPRRGFIRQAAAVKYLEKHIINLIAAGVAADFKGTD